MPDYRFERQCRTHTSEGYEIHDGDQRLGRVDLHYTSTVVYATVVLERELNESGIEELIEVIDNEIVDSADTPRDDLLVTVFQGSEVGVYSDDVFEDEEEEEGTNHH
ncbi:MAG: hypothetical protein HYY05_08990 [Chloroflexi bacterium]|nr:hypothetical protein [Chloroflexota bacterium]